MPADDRYNGVLLLNKPSGISSHDAVMELRRILNQRGIGHTGTLDPLAEGLLVICLGSATKIARFISETDKTYEAEIYLGVRSDTYDAEGADYTAPARHVPDLSDDDLETLLVEFRGEINQKVPAYSAVRIDGKRLYQKARRGQPVERPKRTIKIHDIKLLDYRNPKIRISVTCSQGTYIRTLANDIGEKVGCGAHLSALKRTAVGKFTCDRALTLEETTRYCRTDKLEQHILPIDRALDFSAIKITDEFSRAVVNGRFLSWDDVTGVEGSFSSGDKVLLKNNRGGVLAIGTARVDSEDFKTQKGDQLFNYIRVLN
ncbi:MAG: tRNA pseudouridine(55) synthase TruB [candidate division Zixibacteria bacterium]|nr:tRNA pseudouridine(55) synthase TruB [candidate division Zixibacteria bacterium]